MNETTNETNEIGDNTKVNAESVAEQKIVLGAVRGCGSARNAVITRGEDGAQTLPI
jgi:hypothetical protein